MVEACIFCEPRLQAGEHDQPASADAHGLDLFAGDQFIKFGAPSPLARIAAGTVIVTGSKVSIILSSMNAARSAAPGERGVIRLEPQNRLNDLFSGRPFNSEVQRADFWR